MRVSQTSLKVGELATGQDLTIPIFSLKAEYGTAPNVYIQANVHGAEVQGNAVIYQLIQLLESYTLRGDITLVPLANPLGINQKSGEFTLGRFDPITGVNWNREYLDHKLDIEAWYSENQSLSNDQIIHAFRDCLLESCQTRLNSEWGVTTGHQQAILLQSMAHKADIVLDLHTGPKSCKHLYCPEYDAKAAAFFSIPYTLMIPNDFGGAMDESVFCPWWQLIEFMGTKGRKIEIPVSAFTLELGSQENINLDDALIDAKGILAYLSHRGVITEKVEPAMMSRHACYLRDYKKYHSPLGGMVEYQAEVGKPLKAGEPLANILRLDLYGSDKVLTSLKLEQDCVPILHFASASVYQGTELYKVMTNLFEI
ncbi:succinylglutamate desuccinylase/aspartoacylase family protein [Shewanella nanhaiensis]|uniref:Succinylglutamate desuccinylase/aspartoacylase family protein n=1 Tax=Shewanella nanhaiensis TaxID=2864872 RepID=A0ABS7E3R9_9GAMM|nr:succinylglutamate desuccinylase/aspartoacylase family protein [Shewanella nanhaiensis]MBW8184195.1 succinylglutamate desuccinylase/aspartoacylase family protein [Shewanella nanhaiensis]